MKWYFEIGKSVNVVDGHKEISNTYDVIFMANDQYSFNEKLRKEGDEIAKEYVSMKQGVIDSQWSEANEKDGKIIMDMINRKIHECEIIREYNNKQNNDTYERNISGLLNLKYA